MNNSDNYLGNMEVMLLSIACRNQTETLQGVEQALSWILFDFLLSEYLNARYEGVDV